MYVLVRYCTWTLPLLGSRSCKLATGSARKDQAKSTNAWDLVSGKFGDTHRV